MVNQFRIEIDHKEKSSESLLLEKRLLSLDPSIQIEISRVYTLEDNFSDEEVGKIASSLYNPVAESVRINTPKNDEFTASTIEIRKCYISTRSRHKTEI